VHLAGLKLSMECLGPCSVNIGIGPIYFYARYRRRKPNLAFSFEMSILHYIRFIVYVGSCYVRFCFLSSMLNGWEK